MSSVDVSIYVSVYLCLHGYDFGSQCDPDSDSLLVVVWPQEFLNLSIHKKLEVMDYGRENLYESGIKLIDNWKFCTLLPLFSLSFP